MTQDKKTEAREFSLHEEGMWYVTEELPVHDKETMYHVVEYSAYKKLRDENEALRRALELAANNVTWYDKATDGTDVLYTYGYFVQKCQEVLAKYPRGEK